MGRPMLLVNEDFLNLWLAMHVYGNRKVNELLDKVLEAALEEKEVP